MKLTEDEYWRLNAAWCMLVCLERQEVSAEKYEKIAATTKLIIAAIAKLCRDK